MTGPMTTGTRVREILDCYGADAARWPDEERLAALALVTRDPALAAARREAATLDAALDGWARRDLGTVHGAGRAAAAVLDNRRRWFRWAASGGIAAALGVGLLIAGPAGRPVTSRPAVATAAVTPETAFTTVFTTTPDEDDRI